MKRIILTSLCFLFLTSISFSQNGSLKVRSDQYIQIGYDTYKALTFGQNNDESVNNGGIGIEYWNNGFNFFDPWPNISAANYLMFIRHDNHNIGIGLYPSSSYKLHVNGDIGAMSFMVLSDINLKENIAVFKNSLEKLKQINIYTYDYNIEMLKEKYSILTADLDTKENISDELKIDNGIYTNRIDVMAEELEEIFPNAVKKDENGYLSVNYMELIPVLIAAIKEQQA